jgi:hypothetical protein
MNKQIGIALFLGIVAHASTASATLPLNTQTYRGGDGRIHVASNPQPSARGFSPSNGSRTANGYTVFRNNGGAGSAMDSSGNIRSGRFDIQVSTGKSVFIPSR